jgi:hypothetical protein
MFNTHEDAASQINGEIESLIRKLNRKSSVDEEYFTITRAIRELAAASASLVPPSTEEE